MRQETARVVAAMLVLATAAPCLVGQESQSKTASLSMTNSRDNEHPVFSDQSTLADYRAYAALNNPELEAAFNRWKAALEKIPQAKSLPDPRFSYRYFIREIETRVGPQRQAFEISQMFPWFGKLALAGDVATQAALAAQQRYEAVKLRLFFEVADAYYEYYYLSRSIVLTRENVELLTHLEEVARTRYQTAAGSHADVIRAQVELGKLEDRLKTQLDLRGPVVARLNAVLNRPVEATLPPPQPFALSDVSVDDSALLASLEKDNPQIKALGFEASRYRQAEKLARKQYAPDVTLGLNYIDVARSDLADRFSDNGQDAVGVMLSLNIPIWRHKYSAAVREAQQNHLAALHGKTDATNKLQAQLKMALYGLRDAARKADLYGNALIPKAEESLNVTEQSFQTGEASFLDLIDAQRTYLEFELAYARAKADHEQHLAQIEMLKGSTVSPSRNKTDPTDVNKEDGPGS